MIYFENNINIITITITNNKYILLHLNINNNFKI